LIEDIPNESVMMRCNFIQDEEDNRNDDVGFSFGVVVVVALTTITELSFGRFIGSELIDNQLFNL